MSATPRPRSSRKPRQVFERETAAPVEVRLPRSPAGVGRFNGQMAKQEDAIDRGFREHVEDLASPERREGFLAYAARRGWTGPRLMKDGVRLQSAEGREKDPAAWLALKTANDHLALANELRGASPEAIRLARVAYWAGSNYAEWVAQAQALEGRGRPRERDGHRAQLLELMRRHPKETDAQILTRCEWAKPGPGQLIDHRHRTFAAEVRKNSFR